MFRIYRRDSYVMDEIAPRKKLVISSPLIISIIIIAVLAFTNFSTYFSLNITKNSLASMERVYYKQSASLNEVTSTLQADKDKYYEEKLSSLLSKEELTSLARQNWKYKLNINDIDIIGNSFTTDQKYIYIMLTETNTKAKPLPNKISESGSLTSADKKTNFFDYLKLDSSVKYEFYKEIEGDTTYVYYDIYSMPSGSVINIKLEGPLRERLGLSGDTLQINVK